MGVGTFFLCAFPNFVAKNLVILFFSSNLRKSVCVFHRLGGIISAYKIVPDEIDEIKVICFPISLHMCEH